MGKTRKKANKSLAIAFVGIVIFILAALAVVLGGLLNLIPSGSGYGVKDTMNRMLAMFGESGSKVLFIITGVVVIDAVLLLFNIVYACIRKKPIYILHAIFAALAIILIAFDALLAFNLLANHVMKGLASALIFGSAALALIAWLVIFVAMRGLIADFLPPAEMSNENGGKVSKKGMGLGLVALIFIILGVAIVLLGGPLKYIPRGENYGLVYASDTFFQMFTNTGSKVLGLIAIIVCIDVLFFLIAAIFACVKKKPIYILPDIAACFAVAFLAFLALLTYGLLAHNVFEVVARLMIILAIALLVVGWILMLAAMRPLISSALPPLEEEDEEEGEEEAVDEPAVVEEEPAEEEPAPAEEEKEEEPAPVEEEAAPVEEEKEEEPAPVEEEPAKEEEPAPVEEAPAEEPAPAEEAEAGNGFGDITRRSFAEKLELADDNLRNKYEELKAEAARYGLKGRVSKSGDTYHLGRKNYLKIMIVGKTLRTYYALDPKEYAGSPIPVEDVSEKKAFADMPSMLRVKSDLSLRRAKTLLADMMKADGIEAGETKEAAAAPAEEAPVEETKVLGKYEVYPEEGEFKYRLKANNGEILIVSNGYSSRAGAKSGIETLKKNVEGGVIRIVTDKNGYSQFRIFNANEARLIVSGEFYKTKDRAESASNSVKRFYATEKIVDLDEIPNNERREWIYEAAKEEDKENGKLELFKDDTDKWLARLLASNGEVLFVTANNYASKSGLLEAIENIKGAIGEKDAFRILKDKQDRYQFVVESGNGSILVLGETYASADSAKNAAVSVLSFMDKAEVVDATAAPEAE
ncbi:MAG: YegP family protein [Bacilli bacterium]|nr:YegP family protein [Bacilli bacterium]